MQICLLHCVGPGTYSVGIARRTFEDGIVHVMVADV